jgi:hypothetical protein
MRTPLRNRLVILGVVLWVAFLMFWYGGGMELWIR